MNEILHLKLLGSPSVLLAGQPLTDFATNKAKALLFYLAVTGQPHNRDLLATLLWDGMTDTQAKKNLRAVLPDLRRLLGNYIYIDRQTVAFELDRSYWLDVGVLKRDLKPNQSYINTSVLQAAVDLYRGEFLTGFYVHNAPAFDAWVQQQREQIHILVVDALFSLVHEHMQRTDYPAGLAANRRLLLLEPWSEPAHRQQMQLLAHTGDRAAALAQYETCRAILWDEFGVEPLAETTALYAELRAGESNAGQAAPVIGRSATTVQREYSSAFMGSATENKPNTDGAQPPQVVGHNLSPRTKLYGRQIELTRIQKWVIEDSCRLVGIFGIGGQGKTALASALVQALPDLSTPDLSTQMPTPAGGFVHIIWRSLLNAPPLPEVMREWFYILSNQTVTSLPTSFDQQYSQLLAYLRSQRCLLILDNLESILQGDVYNGFYRPGYELYGQLIHHLAESEHRSCLLLTSRERPQDLTHLEEDTPAVRFLSLTGLPADAGRQMLVARGLVDDSADLDTLVDHYSGNPLALQLAADTVQSIFNGDIGAFLKAETLVFDDIRHVLDQQFARLSPLEREIMYWLATVREPLPFASLRPLLAQPSSPRLVLEAMRALQRRSLVEQFDEGFGLQNVV
ncbi:MAG: hypothetical protein KDE47_31750, partial [Caldilineaceae bacterium]|nr:hypothetical protein [Caldilineaceae bacterium]